MRSDYIMRQPDVREMRGVRDAGKSMVNDTRFPRTYA
jgi:hypothetical protein